MLKIPAPDPIDYLVKRKFPELVEPLHPMARAFANDGIVYEDDEPEEWRPPSQTTLEKADKYREKLTSLSKPEVKKLYRDELAKQYEEQDKKRYFNQPDAEADFDYWAKMAHWKLDEAIALSFGKNPEVVYWKRLDKILSYTSPFVQEYSKTRELAMRAKTAGKLSDPVLPQQYVNWAISNQIPFPKELAEKVKDKWSNFVDWEKMYKGLLEENKRLQNVADKATEVLQDKIGEITSNTNNARPLQKKEKETLLKLLLGLALTNYTYNPRANRNSTSKEIADDLLLHGLSVDEDTVRKWLNQAKELLPEDWQNEN